LEIGVTEEIRSNLRNCIRDLLVTRVQRDDMFRREHLSLVELVETWTRLKLLRTKNGFISTPYQLVLRSQKIQQSDDLDRYQEALEDELDEREILYTLDQPERQRQYEEELTVWQERISEWEEAQREVDSAIRENRSLVSQEVAHLAARSEPLRPDPPRSFQRREELRLIEDRLSHSRRTPGDPVYIPKLKKNVAITETPACPMGERARRANVASQRLFIRVIMNDREVCRSTPHVLNEDFTVVVSKTFSVLVEFVPASIKVEIFEEIGFRNRKLAETFVAVPDETATFETAEEQAVEFSTPEKVPSANQSVGSGEKKQTF
jgi:CC2D2A N-terminal C2 domain